MMRIAHLSDDLIDHSKVRATLVSANCRVEWVRDWTIDFTLFDYCLLNLHFPGLVMENLSISNAKSIGYGSHVDVERLKKARATGLWKVMPRSQFFELLAAGELLTDK